MKDNPAYAPTAGFTSRFTTLQDNLAYASTSNAVSVNDDTVYDYILENT